MTKADRYFFTAVILILVCLAGAIALELRNWGDFQKTATTTDGADFWGECVANRPELRDPCAKILDSFDYYWCVRDPDTLGGTPRCVELVGDST